MKRLTGLDTSFLNLETSTSFGHVNSLSIYQRPKGQEGLRPVSSLSRSGRVKAGMARAVSTPPGRGPTWLDRPYWISDFDLDFDVRHVGVPGEGSEERVGTLSAV